MTSDCNMVSRERESNVTSSRGLGEGLALDDVRLQYGKYGENGENGKNGKYGKCDQIDDCTCES